MTTHVLVSCTPTDAYQPQIVSGDEVLRVLIDTTGDGIRVETNFETELTGHGLRPESAVEDLVRLALAVQVADTRVAREAAYDEWTRDLFLHIGVADLDRWQGTEETLATMLAFLTGDRWRIAFHAGSRPKRLSSGTGRITNRLTRKSTSVALFSGGLDSFIGAVDLLAAHEKVALVGQQARGQGPTSSAQTGALSVLQKAYGRSEANFVRFWVSVVRGSRPSDTSFRGRSFLFVTLAVLVAASTAASRVVISENGLLSLNVPLTNARTGSFSTRTTHPFFITKWRELLNSLGISVALDLPYRFQSKGEMLKGCIDQPTLSGGYTATMSCAHPGVGRYSGESSNQHCGYCFPCLVRRAAISSWTTDTTTYRYQSLGVPLPNGGADLRAVRLGLARDAATPPTVARLLTGGPLPGSSGDLAGYLDAYLHGMDELRALVGSIPQAT